MSTADTQRSSRAVSRERALASQAQLELASCLASGTGTQRIQVIDRKKQPHPIELPTAALRMLLDILAALADGHAVKVVPIHTELTTQEAADMLNVSRPHLVSLLEEGALKFHKTGKHRRVLFADLMQYKSEREAASELAMQELAQQAQELRMGYE